MSSTPDELIRDRFLAWQCRIRQIATRQDGGRPSQGMRPEVLLKGGEVLSPGIVMLIIPKEPDESTDFFRFQVQKNNDPAEVYQKGLQFLQGIHFQASKTYSDEMTALFPMNSEMAEKLVEEGECLLAFEQYSQRYHMFCRVREFETSESSWQATFWHNHLFNSALPPNARILGFKPDWSSAQADPAS